MDIVQTKCKSLYEYTILSTLKISLETKLFLRYNF